MKKKFDCEIDCANCAAKIQDAILKMEGVQFTLEAEDARFEEILKEAVRVGKTIEPDFSVLGV